MLFNKRGQLSGMDETIPGLLIGIIITVILIGVGVSFWGLFMGGSGIDSLSQETFELVTNDILDMYKLNESPREVPVQFDDEYTLVAFGSDTGVAGKCNGNGVIRSAKCEGVCICLCENEYGENMCNSKKVICRDFAGIGLDFEGDCNLVDGESGLQIIKINQENNKFTIS